MFLKLLSPVFTSDCGKLIVKNSPEKQIILQIRGMHSSTKLKLFADLEILDQNFLRTDLGRLYQAIPFEELAQKIPAPRQAQSGRGCKPWFDIKGGIALQILKHYHNLSDQLLIERINTDWSMQMFCGICLGATERIEDKNIVSLWRVYLSNHLDILNLQDVLAKYWKPNMDQTNVGSQDATCYESGVSYPTDAKLLWSCTQDIFELIEEVRKQLGLRKSRINFGKYRKIFMDYQKLRKKVKERKRSYVKYYLDFY